VKKEKATKDRGIKGIILFSIIQRSYFIERFTKTDSISPLELLCRSNSTKADSLVKLSYQTGHKKVLFYGFLI